MDILNNLSTPQFALVLFGCLVIGASCSFGLCVLAEGRSAPPPRPPRVVTYRRAVAKVTPTPPPPPPAPPRREVKLLPRPKLTGYDDARVDYLVRQLRDLDRSIRDRIRTQGEARGRDLDAWPALVQEMNDHGYPGTNPRAVLDAWQERQPKAAPPPEPEEERSETMVIHLPEFIAPERAKLIELTEHKKDVLEFVETIADDELKEAVESSYRQRMLDLFDVPDIEPGTRRNDYGA